MSGLDPQQAYLKLLDENSKLREELKSLDISLNSYKELNKLSTERIDELQDEYSYLKKNLLAPIQKSLTAGSIPDLTNVSSTYRSTNISRSNSLKRILSREFDSLHIFDKPSNFPMSENVFFFSFHLIAPIFTNHKKSEENEEIIKKFEADIVFSFPEGGILQEYVKKKILELAFVGKNCYRKLDLNESVANQISEVIYQAHYRDGNSFTVKIDSEEKDQDRDFYACFVNFEDLGSGVNGEQAILPVCYCMLSFCPCFELHFSVLNRMLDLKRTSRCDVTQVFLETGDVSIFLSENSISLEEQALLSNYYTYLNQISLEKDLSIVIPLDSVENIEYDFPEDLKFLDQLWFCPLLFSSLRLSDFYRIFCAILQEKSVVFFSKNLDLLTSSVLAFNSLLQPLRWQYPLIPLLTKSQEKIIAENKSFIFGINHKHKKFLRKRVYWYVNLDKGYIRPCGDKFSMLQVHFPFTYNLEEFIKENYVQLSGCICYSPDEQQVILTKCILNEIYLFTCWVIDSLKSYCRTKNIMDFQIHREIIKLNSGNDKDFFVSIFETEMFTMYNY